MTPQIHPTAVVHPGAEIHPTVQIGPHCSIGERVKLGPGTQVGANVVIDGWTEIGARNRIFPGAVVGLEPQDLKYSGDETLVQIGNDNRIRECVTINRATKGGEMTRIGNGNLLMAYVHVAHNCVLQDKIVIANAVSLAGHVEIESQAVIGGMSGFHQFVHVGKLAMVGAMSRIDRDVPPFTLVEGSPARVRTLNVLGLKRAGVQELEDGATYRALKKAYRILFRNNRALEEGLRELEPLLHVDLVRHLYHFAKTSSQAPGRRGMVPGKS
ncbi:MAG: acyl-ACP--UDP-N-acetylglucosamine O-acyltransferase [Synechococcales cyanobacterium RM1_1_8]|nr:acyl-ACP--UDP-N-acetylglucosamine O-acyltransferase [Synechococcales cyanobacterium RM1_1_8]